MLVEERSLIVVDIHEMGSSQGKWRLEERDKL